MHAYSLCIGSILGHEYATAIVGDAQRIVTYVRASHLPKQLLGESAKHHNINTTLKTSNTTRFTSIYDCLESVHKLEVPLKAVVAEHRSAFAAPKRGAVCARQ